MDFGGALIMLRHGYKVARRGWNGKGMFVYYVPGSTFKVAHARPPLNEHYADRPLSDELTYRPHIDMKYADGTHGVWLASQSDMLGDDWVIVT